MDRAIVVYALLVVTMGVFVGGSLLFHDKVSAFLGGEGETAPAAVRASASSPPVARSAGRRADVAGQGTGWGTASAFAPATPPFSRFVANVTLAAPVEADDGDTLRGAGGALALAFIRPRPRGDFCLDSFLNRGRCTQMARTALQRLVGPVGVDCGAIFYPMGKIRYQCFAGSVDVASRQLASGFVRRDLMAATVLPVRPLRAPPAPASHPAPGLRSTL